uniref:Hemagglutinin-esterase n=1 Tax=Pika coronavirus TaxID=3027598 RepID=A0AAT9T6B0_9NIDO|nr:MAG: H [Pika coronavirus] [Pika coronavirus]
MFISNLFLVSLVTTVCAFNEPQNVVSHTDEDWFLFGDSRTDCALHPNDYAYLDLNTALCNSGKISSKGGNSLFRSFHFTDYYNYTGGGQQVIFYEGVNFSPFHNFKCTSQGSNAVWMDNKRKFYTAVYQAMSVYRNLSFVTVTHTYNGTDTLQSFCKTTGSSALTLNNPGFMNKPASVGNSWLYNDTLYFNLQGCDEYIIPLCIFQGPFLSNYVNYNDSQYYYSWDTGFYLGRNNTVFTGDVVDFSCDYVRVSSGNYTSHSSQLWLTFPTKAVCLQHPKNFTPVQVVDSRWSVQRASDNMTAEACQPPYCIFRNTSFPYVGTQTGVSDINHGDTHFRELLLGLLYNVACIAEQGAYNYSNVTTTWPTNSFGQCPTASTIQVDCKYVIYIYDQIPIILLSVFLGLAILIIIVLTIMYLMKDTRSFGLHEA